MKIAAIIVSATAIVTGLFYFWIESMMTSPIEDVAVAQASSGPTPWLGPTLALCFAAAGLAAFLKIFGIKI